MMYYVYSHKSEGLLSKDQLAEMPLLKDDLVKAEDADAWVEAEKVADLADLFAPQVPTDSEDSAPNTSFDADEAIVEAESSGESESASGTETQTVVPASSQPFVNFSFDDLKKRWKFYLVAGVVVLALLLMVTNPSRRKHAAVVEKMVETSVGQLKGASLSVDPFFDFFFGDMFPFGDMFSAKKQVANQLFNDVSYSNCVLFSFCSVDNGDEGSHWLTFGIFGHVFGFNQDDLDEHMDLMINPQKQKKEKQPEGKQKEQSVPQEARPL